MVESADRSDTNCFHAGVADLSSAFPTCLASPVISHGDHGQSLIPCPSGTDRHRYDRWQNLATRGTHPGRREDGWRAIICRGTDQSPSGIRASEGREWALRTHRVFTCFDDSIYLTGFVD